MKNVYRISFSDDSICELEAISELDAKIKALKFRKNYGGMPYEGMIQAQRPYIVEGRGIYITSVEKIG